MIFVVRTEDDVSGLDVSLTLMNASIKHDLLVKEKNEWFDRMGTLKAEVERLKGEKQKLLDVLRPVAIIGNHLVHKQDIWEFLAPSGYKKAYEVYNEVTK